MRWRWVLLLASVFLLAHVPFLAPALEDVDSVNFALGVRDYDVTKHQPHPPGYPVYIALAKLSTGVMRAAGSATDMATGRAEARGLAIWSALLGALAAFPLFQLFCCVEDDPRRALAATVLTLSAPLVWLTSSRPMSDVPGFFTAVAVAALLATAFRAQHRTTSGPVNPGDSGRWIVAGAFLAGLAIGLRSQIFWLAVPLLVVVLFDRVGRDAAGALLGSILTFSIGVLIWAVPLLIITGGPTRYVNAFTVQAGEDIAGVEMLINNPTPRRVAFALLETFVYPWSQIPLAVVVLALASAGGVVMVWRSRRGLLLLTAAFLPYALFHLLFQDTPHTRYAIPLIPALVYLCVRALDTVGRRVSDVAIAVIVLASLAIGVTETAKYAREASPVFRALGDMTAKLSEQPADKPVLAMHHAARRAIEVADLDGLKMLEPLPRREWISLVDYWDTGAKAPVWFLGDPRRTDLALVDPSARHLVRSYRWPLETTTLLGGMRPNDLDWQEIRAPGWFALEGWSLTPETAGVAKQTRQGLDVHPIVARIRRRSESTVLMIGGRHLGAEGEPDARFTLTFDGRPLDTWTATPEPGFFLRFLTLPAGALEGEGELGRLEVKAEAADGSGRPLQTAIEQFNLQSAASVVFGYDRGWHEQEHNPSTGRLWRWTSDRSDLHVVHAGRDLTLRLEGESPLLYFNAPVPIRVRCGSDIVGQTVVANDFDWSIRVPADALEKSGGIVTVETDRVFVPSDRSPSPDHRRLGLRIYRVEFKPAS